MQPGSTNRWVMYQKVKNVASYKVWILVMGSTSHNVLFLYWALKVISIYLVQKSGEKTTTWDTSKIPYLVWWLKNMRKSKSVSLPQIGVNITYKHIWNHQPPQLYVGRCSISTAWWFLDFVITKIRRFRAIWPSHLRMSCWEARRPSPKANGEGSIIAYLKMYPPWYLKHASSYLECSLDRWKIISDHYTAHYVVILSDWIGIVYS